MKIIRLIDNDINNSQKENLTDKERKKIINHIACLYNQMNKNGIFKNIKPLLK